MYAAKRHVRFGPLATSIAFFEMSALSQVRCSFDDLICVGNKAQERRGPLHRVLTRQFRENAAGPRCLYTGRC